jgi:ribosomal protein L32
MMKSRKKQPSWKRGTKKTSTTLELIPAASCSNSGTSLGDSVVELASAIR